jgi:hypothetical protein
MAAILAGIFHRQWKKNELDPMDRLFLAFPLAFAYPRQSYTYGLVFFPALLVFYSRAAKAGGPTKYLAWAGCAGVVLSCFPSAYLAQVVPHDMPSDWAWTFNSYGVMFCLFANAVLAWRPLPQARPARPATAHWRFAELLRIGRWTEWSGLAALSLAAVFFTARYTVFKNEQILFFKGLDRFEQARAIAGANFRIGHHRQGWGDLQINLAVSGSPLSMRGMKFATGIGTHGVSRTEIFFPPGTTRFSGICGIDDNAGNQASGAIFKILADNITLFQTGIHFGETQPDAFDIDVTGRSRIELIVDNAGTSSAWNQADWVNLEVK